MESWHKTCHLIFYSKIFNLKIMIKLVKNEPEAFLFIMLGNFRILQAK